MTHPVPVQLTEIFHSVQGEGEHVGLPTVFVRLTGCSLRCSWCDTTYSFYGGEATDVDEVLSRVAKFPTKRVCLTGGEPLDQMEASVALVGALLAKGYEVVVETSGGVDVAPIAALEPRAKLLLSLDVKCPGSNMQLRNRWENLAHLAPHDQLKFVLADERDYEFAKRVIAERGPFPCRILMQPMWPSPNPVTETKIAGGPMTLQMLAERVLADGIDVRVGTQLHKVIWGHEKGR
ncbi:MAG: radical SAM protein [Thermoplasmatota archaeon]